MFCRLGGENVEQQAEMMLRKKEVCRRLAVSPRTFDRLAADARDPLPVFKLRGVRVVSENDLHDWLKRQKEAVSGQG